MLPREIEEESFRIITEELEQSGICLEGETADIIKRAIHTSADFGYVENLVFSKEVVGSLVECFSKGCTIVTDTNMAKAGINKAACKKLNIQVECYVADEDVARLAKERETTRSAISMEKALQIEGNVVFAIGNAPTALIQLKELIDHKKCQPSGIIAAPVGFVNVVESKELILDLEETPYIVARGRKGGSNIVASIVNALLYKATSREE